MSQFRRVVSVIGIAGVLAAFACSHAVAEQKPGLQVEDVLDNNYDCAFNWDDGGLFLKNCSDYVGCDPIHVTEQTKMIYVESDGTTRTLENASKFDTIYNVEESYACAYLLVGKGDKMALLQKDGSILGNAWYNNIYAFTDHFAEVEDGNGLTVLKLDGSVPALKYDAASGTFNLKETARSLCVRSYDTVVDLFDLNLQKIDLSRYDKVQVLFSGDCFLTQSGEKCGVIDDTGKEVVPADYSAVIPLTYQGASYFVGEHRDAKDQPVDFSLYKEDGTLLANRVSGGIDSYANPDSTDGCVVLEQNGAYGIFDLNTMTVKAEPRYQKILALDRRCFAYQLDGKQGVKTYDNQDLIASGKYDGILPRYFISDGLVVVNVDNAQFVYTTFVYDEDTAELVFSYSYGKPDYFLSGYKNGVAKYLYVYCNTPVGLFDKSGAQVLPPEDYPGRLAECCTVGGQTVFAVETNGKIGLIDSGGQPLTDVKYSAMGGPYYGEVDGFQARPMFGGDDQQFILTRQKQGLGLVEVRSAAQTALHLNQTAAVLQAGETVTLTATLTPDGTSGIVLWTSSDESVAAVKDGVVTALKPGKAIVTASIGGASATCTVTVTEKGPSDGTTATTTQTDTTASGATTITGTGPSGGGSPATGNRPIGFGVAAVGGLLSASVLLAIRKKQGKTSR